MRRRRSPRRSVRSVLASTMLVLLASGIVHGQAIGDSVDAFLEASGAVPGEAPGHHRIGSLEVRLDAPAGVLARVRMSASLDAAGIVDAARTMALASGYGAGIEEPLASFLETRAAELAGGDPVVVRLEEFELEVVVHDGEPRDAELTLSLPHVPDDAFGAPVASVGPDDADVVVREFSDFQCPFCKRYAEEILPDLQRSLAADGAVRFEFHHFPLDSIHANASPAAEAAQCVVDLYGAEAFWAFHDLLFERQSAWQGLGDAQPYFARLVGELPADLLTPTEPEGASEGAMAADDASAARARVQECQEQGAAAQAVRRAADRARSLRLTGTPTVFVGGYQLQNFGDPAAYARRLRLERAVHGAGSVD